MYLFGFPEGLAGGSKETTYATEWDTSHTTNYITNWNSTWNTNRTTSRNTTLYRTMYTHSYDWAPIYDINKFFLRVHASNHCQMRYTWWLPKNGTTGVPPLGVPTTKIGSGVVWGTKNEGIIYFDPNDIGTDDSPLIRPAAGLSPSVNEGKIINTTALRTDYQYYGAFKIKVGPLAWDYANTIWDYKITIVESLNLDGSLHPTQSFSFSPYPYQETYAVATSWNTVSHQTSVPTSLSTTHDTTYQTASLTSHITYG